MEQNCLYLHREPSRCSVVKMMVHSRWISFVTFLWVFFRTESRDVYRRKQMTAHSISLLAQVRVPFLSSLRRILTVVPPTLMCPQWRKWTEVHGLLILGDIIGGGTYWPFIPPTVQYCSRTAPTPTKYPSHLLSVCPARPPVSWREQKYNTHSIALLLVITWQWHLTHSLTAETTLIGIKVFLSLSAACVFQRLQKFGSEWLIWYNVKPPVSEPPWLLPGHSLSHPRLTIYAT